MAQGVIQTNFGGGEWSPDLFSRVDMAKYHSAAALLRNFYVDYRGGASSRMGFRYILQARNSNFPVRLIPFQASFTVTYVLEFGQNYLRFYSNGAPVLEATTVITGATQANPGVITDPGHGYSNGDWIFIQNVVGMTQLNGNYYIVANVTTNTYTLTDLNGNAINTTLFGAYVSGGTAQRVYTVQTPYLAADLALLKFAQNVTSLILCHPNYAPQVLTIIAANNWTLSSITFGPTITSPTGVAFATNLGGGQFFYKYLVTAVDINGQESAPSAPVGTGGFLYIGNTAGTNTITWNAVSGAVSYNVYKALPATAAVVAGAAFGFIGNVTTTSFQETFPGIAPDFSQTPPIVQNPFLGAGVVSYIVTTPSTYTTVPGVTVAPPSGGATATAYASLGAVSVAINTGGTSYNIGDTLTLINFSGGGGPSGVVVQVTSVGASNAVTGVNIIAPGSVTSGSTPANPETSTGSPAGRGASFNVTWGVTAVIAIQDGSGYTSVPAVTFSAGAAAATAVLGTASSGNPEVPGFFQQRMVLAAQPQALQSFFFSQPGTPYNFNTTDPTEADNAISGFIASGVLNQIKSLAPVPAGLIMFTNRASWLVNGGSAGSPITPTTITANAQSFNGAADVPPIISNFDVLYVQSKGSIIRDLSFNFYAQIYTGTDISILSSHLFYGYLINEWAWAEEPFKTVWAVRNDGTLLSLGYVKEQEMQGWAHSDTQGLFKSVCTVTEQVAFGAVDAIYCVVQRLINGNWIQYIERMAERYFPYGMEDAWCVDAGLQTIPFYSGNSAISQATNGFGVTVTASAPSGNGVTLNFSLNLGFGAPNIGQIIRIGGGIATITAAPTGSQLTVNFTQAMSSAGIIPNTNTPIPFTTNWSLWIPVTTINGLQHLIGMSVVGLGDGVVIGPFTVSATGSVALGATYSKVTLGLAYTPQLQTLRVDLGEPTIQGKRKAVTGLTVRVKDTLGLSAGKTLNTLTKMKDFELGQLNEPSNSAVNNLYTGDGRVILDPQYDTFGNYYIVQPNPLPATILGVIPEITHGDAPR